MTTESPDPNKRKKTGLLLRPLNSGTIGNVRIISVRKRPGRKEGHMKKEYDFSKGKRGAVIPQVGKTRITIYLDDAILKRFKAESERTGKGYQTLINDTLNSYLGLTEKPLTAEMVRKIVREELSAQN